MPNDFHKLFRLNSAECSCTIVNEGFPAARGVDDGNGNNYDPLRWELIRTETFDVGTVDQSSDDMEITGGIARFKWIGSCPRFSRGVLFVIQAEQLNSAAVGYLLYATDQEQTWDSGYRVTWNHVEYADLAASALACDLEIRYNGTVILHRNVAAGYGDPIGITFEHIPDADGGGVHITLNEVGTFTHLDGPQISASNAYWGFGGSDIKFLSVTATHSGNLEGGRYCRNCEEIVPKTTGCDLNATCSGGTFIQQPGEDIQEYDWQTVACNNSYGITPHHDGGWYKICTGSGTTAAVYSAWTFSGLTSALDLSTYGICGSGMPGATDAYEASRFFRITNCNDNIVSLTVDMNKSKYTGATASIVLNPVCGVDSQVELDIPVLSLLEIWTPSTTASHIATTTCSGSASSYFVADACVMDDSDTVTLDLEDLPVGIYKATVTGFVGLQGGVLSAVYTGPCTGVAATIHLPVTYDFTIGGDALEYDPICH